jgi:predicted NBD/HSP70 family sugar kinase
VRLDLGGRSLRLSVPAVAARLGLEATASTLVRLVASGAAVTRADLVRVTGLARTSVTEALDQLTRAGVVEYLGTRSRTGRGRPADVLGLSPSLGVLLVADLGVRHARISVADAGQRILRHEEFAVDLARGPESVLGELTDRFKAMLASVGGGRPRRLAMVMGMPGPVDTSRGVPVKPPIMPGWDEFPVAETLGSSLDCEVLCENDVNLRALGEARALPEDQCPLLYIKASTGIGSGLVTTTGELYHGADGAAGDIGHIPVSATGQVPCVCGGTNCVEAVASAPAILRRAQEVGTADDEVPQDMDDLGRAIRANNRVVVGVTREAAAKIGEVVAVLVHVFNPARIVLGGSLTVPSDDLLAGVRAVVYHRALPLATRNLVITKPVLGQWSGTAGGLVIGQEHALTPEALAPLLRGASAGREMSRSGHR